MSFRGLRFPAMSRFDEPVTDDSQLVRKCEQRVTQDGLVAVAENQNPAISPELSMLVLKKRANNPSMG
jgi:hypothetical protein